MFSMSLKSVPGTLVLIAPMVIGEPVALTPGLVPHADVTSAGADDALVDGAALVAAEEVVGEVAVVVLDELQPAMTPSAIAATEATASREPRCSYLFMFLCLLVAKKEKGHAERKLAFAGAEANCPTGLGQRPCRLVSARRSFALPDM
jgi:hypothetical protein